MTPDAETELRALRRRAYAPDGDIDGDAAALARLAELEDLARRDAAPPAPAAPAAPAVPAAAAVLPPSAAAPTPDEEPAQGLDIFDVDAPAASSRIRTRRRRRPGLAALWAASVVVALVVGAVATWGSVRLVSRASGVDQVAVLQEDPTRTLPAELSLGDVEDVRVYRDFAGVTVVTAQAPWTWSGGRENCLIVASSVDFDGDPGRGFGTLGNGCGAGEFAATVQLRVGGELPGPLVERFGEGTAVQFVFDGERVAVYAGQRPSEGTDAAGG